MVDFSETIVKVCMYCKLKLELSEDLTIAPLQCYLRRKNKLVPENWRDGGIKYQRIIPKPHEHLHSIQKTSAKFQNN